MPGRASTKGSGDHQSPSHVGVDGVARMVDVGDKAVTVRRAVACGEVVVSRDLARAIRRNTLVKGNLLQVAQLAGVQAAKRTDELIPLCHSLPLDFVDVTARLVGRRVVLRAEARTTARTGVEMEALTAVCAAALTVIDMGKSIDKGMVVMGVRLLEKSGGRSGDYTAPRRTGTGRAR
ncbi:MAG: cyclic pyranopterin monophosphate synthase MoaC [Phycisphaerales bacterium]|nr:cyclic pyranopterin monophosphate synthase MoaC [Phycisphaerales bacterium]